MKPPAPAYDITDISTLEQLFGSVNHISQLKELDHIDANYAAWIAASPFCALATAGPGGLDCSPRGDERGFVRVLDRKTLLLPERRGNNRIDSLRNIIADPRVALLFLIPGQGETLRVNGRCLLNSDPELCAELAVAGKPPRLVLVLSVESAYFQCSRALVRSRLWDVEQHVAPGTLPTPGKILEDITRQRIDGVLGRERIDGEQYDRELPARVRSTLY
jgi:uncharacterized protein